MSTSSCVNGTVAHFALVTSFLTTTVNNYASEGFNCFNGTNNNNDIIDVLGSTKNATTFKSLPRVYEAVKESFASEDLFYLFQNPPASAKPFVRWWWNGDCIELDELERELDVMQAAGIGGEAKRDAPVETNV